MYLLIIYYFIILRSENASSNNYNIKTEFQLKHVNSHEILTHIIPSNDVEINFLK